VFAELAFVRRTLSWVLMEITKPETIKIKRIKLTAKPSAKSLNIFE
jgi:hypothetical protein